MTTEVTNIDFAYTGASSIDFTTTKANRHDVSAVTAGLTVNALTEAGGVALIGTVAAGTVGSFSFGADRLRITSDGAGSGELRSYKD